MHGFVCVHVGAGIHSESLEKKYEQLCQEASKRGINVLAGGGTALDAVTEAVMLLEDSPLTNAGLGSNLSWDGKVECDASVMSGVNLTFGACGAVAGVKNPVLLAKHICELQQMPLSLGRVHPSLLAGEGAIKFARDQNIPTVQPESLISAEALKTYRQCKRKVARYEEHMTKKVKFQEENEIGDEEQDHLQQKLDTVGAISVDNEGNIAVACSSGGVLLKHSGRIGQAAVQGAGCWTDGTVGVVSSGCGEHLIATCLAREAVRNLKVSDCPITALRATVINDFLGSPMLVKVEEKLAGLLAVQVSEGGRGEMLYAHTTGSMCVGYMATNYKKPKSRMSRLTDGAKHGYSVKIEGVFFE